MNALVRGGLVAAVSLTLTATTFANTAEAQSRRGKVAAGVAAGLIIGGIVAGAAAANARGSGGTTYVAPAPRASCNEYKRRAVWNEENGNWSRAQYNWDRYEACRNN